MQVHPYISTGMASSKFGIRNTHLEWFLEAIRAEPLMELVGAHCHLGSTIKDVTPFRDAARIMCDFIRQINGEGFTLRYLNFGGGLGIDYTHSGEAYPSPKCAVTSDVAPRRSTRALEVSTAVWVWRSSKHIFTCACCVGPSSTRCATA